MSSAMNWRAEEQPNSDGVSAVIHLPEASLDNRIETLREIASTLVEKLESLQSARPGRGRSNGSRCRKFSCCRPARCRRRAFWSKACR